MREASPPPVPPPRSPPDPAGYSLWQQRHALDAADLPIFLTGLVMAFLSALVCIRWLIRYVSTHDFSAFGWYRIVFGGLILGASAAGWVAWPAS